MKENIGNLNVGEYMLNYNGVSSKAIALLKKGIWIYFFLLIFEGALRKWILPGLAAPLLIVRDPVALWVMFTAYKYHLFPRNKYIVGMFILCVISILFTFSLGHGNFGVTLFGARILLIHFPFMFVMGKILTKEDILKIGKVVLVISIPMVILIGLQFYSPQSALVNRGVGGDMEGAGFGSGDYLRPSGTFSFTSGNVLFFQMVTAFVFYFFMNSKNINRLVLVGASIAFIMAIPLSISRTLFFNLWLVILFMVIAVSRKKEYFSKVISIGFVVIIAFMILSQTSFFQTSLGAFTDRFETANEEEGGLESVLLDRFLGGLLGALTNAFKLKNVFGYGLGMGTNAGAKLLTGKTGFLISEGEWGRLIGEMGPLIGLAVIYIRIHFSFRLLYISYSKMRQSEMLPWMLLSIGLLAISQGQWASPTELGFSTIFGGMIIAAFRSENPLTKNIPETGSTNSA